MAVEIEGAWTEAQESVIGSLCIDPDAVAGLIFSKARPEYFSDSGLRHIFEAALELWAERKPIDIVTILHAAGGEYEEILRHCMRETLTAANIEAYLEVLRSQARLAQVRASAQEMVWARTEKDALTAFERVGQILRDTDSIQDMGWAELIADYLRRMEDPAPEYLSWGFSSLDRGLQVVPGDFVTIGADSSVGKTALALQFAVHMAMAGKRVLFISLETSTEKLEDRLMAETQVASIAMPRTKLRALTEKDFVRATTAADIDAYRGEPIFFRIIRNAATLVEIRNRIIMHGADVVFVDYLQIIDHKGSGRAETVTEISMGLHRIAQSLRVCVVALSQITPPEPGEKLTMDNLLYSKQIKRDSEIVLLMEKDDSWVPGGRRLTIAKDKDGQPGRNMLLDFDPEHMTFSYAKRRKTDTVPDPEPPMFETTEEATPYE